MLGLDFGTYAIKAVLARPVGKGYEVAKWAEVPTPAGAMTGGQVNPGPELVAALRALMGQLGPGVRDAAVSIPAQLALVRRVSMPRLPVRRLRALIEAQGEQFIPFYRDGATFDLVVTNPNLSAQEQEILLVAVPTSVVERLRAVLRAAGLRLAAVDVDLLALYRASVALGTVAPGTAAVVLDVGHQRARLGLFSGGWPAVVRTLDMLPLLPGEVEPSPDARFLAPEEFVVEVRRTIEILLAQSRAEATAALVLSARGSGEAMVDLLEDELRHGLAGRVESEFRVVPAGGSVAPPGLALAFGLALAPAVAPFRLALLPRATMDVQRQRRTAALLLLATMIGSGAYGWYWYNKGLGLQAERTRLTRLIDTHNAYLKKEKEIAALEARRKDFDPLVAAYGVSEPWSVLYPHFRSLLPPGVTLVTVSVSGQNLNISGRAATPEGLAEFVQRLHTSPHVNPPVLSTFTQKPPPGMFQISGMLKPRGGGGQ